ncbi:UNKNOWN [Stylonychia lemnae]|uniref:Uncharacterized protein n=1 Tax=Stylonychia lemnae TaxID=5949 RepID=A0A078ADR4_STYLE|nr:UNKNOWN [Stylonychia lemnae]|eukprot:CDW80364.1 UNKNOWN [Stylonychia lemnae]
MVTLLSLEFTLLSLMASRGCDMKSWSLIMESEQLKESNLFRCCKMEGGSLNCDELSRE